MNLCRVASAAAILGCLLVSGQLCAEALSTPSPRVTVDPSMAMAIMALESNRPTQAVEELERFLGQKTASTDRDLRAQASLLLGVAYERSGETARAEKIFREIVESMADTNHHWNAMAELAHLLYSLGRVSEALPLLDRLKEGAEGTDQMMVAFRLKTLACEAGGMRAEADAELALATRKLPSAPHLVNLYLELAAVRSQRDPVASLKIFDRLFERFPEKKKGIWCLSEWAWAAMKAGRHGEVVRVLEAYLASGEGSVEDRARAEYILGVAERDMLDIPSAKKHLEAALSTGEPKVRQAAKSFIDAPPLQSSAEKSPAGASSRDKSAIDGTSSVQKVPHPVRGGTSIRVLFSVILASGISFLAAMGVILRARAFGRGSKKTNGC